MPNVAFYRVVTDATVIRFPGEGSTATTQDVTFNTTNDIVLNESESRPILGFLMDPSEKLESETRDLHPGSVGSRSQDYDLESKWRRFPLHHGAD